MENNEMTTQVAENIVSHCEPKDYAFRIEKQYYKKESEKDVKSSFSVKLDFLGGTVTCKPLSKQYGALCRFAEKHPELVIERNSAEEPFIIEDKQ